MEIGKFKLRAGSYNLKQQTDSSLEERLHCLERSYEHVLKVLNDHEKKLRLTGGSVDNLIRDAGRLDDAFELEEMKQETGICWMIFFVSALLIS